jgi:hypothetical protein
MMLAEMHVLQNGIQTLCILMWQAYNTIVFSFYGRGIVLHAFQNITLCDFSIPLSWLLQLSDITCYNRTATNFLYVYIKDPQIWGTRSPRQLYFMVAPHIFSIVIPKLSFYTYELFNIFLLASGFLENL